MIRLFVIVEKCTDLIISLSFGKRLHYNEGERIAIQLKS